jgi:hypothetical protein
MRKHLSVAGGFAYACACALAALTALPAHASVQSPAARGAVGTTARAAHQASLTPPPQPFYDYAATGYKSECFAVDGGGADVNWSTYGCRNVDESIDNQASINGASFIVRLYYSPNEGGAWTCVPVGEEIGNLNNKKYTFNSGSGPGAGDMVWNNVASSAASDTGSCTNPIG